VGQAHAALLLELLAKRYQQVLRHGQHK
jgi:hypothetical protein